MPQLKKHMNITDFYDIEGEGPLVVFIHGSFSSSAAWKHYTATLSSDYKCLSIKLPGHNSPELPKEATARFTNDAEFIEYLLGRLVENPIKLIGHSYGAVLCCELALRGNIEIECMTLFEPVSAWALRNIGNDALTAQLQGFLIELNANYQIAPELICPLVINFLNNAETFDSLPDKAKEQMSRLAVHNIQHWISCIDMWHETSQLNDMPTPTTIVFGTASHPIIQEISSYLSESIKNAEKVKLPRANHLLINTHVNTCLAIIQSDFHNSLTRNAINILGVKSLPNIQA